MSTVTIHGQAEAMRLPAYHPAQSGAATPMDMISRALASGASVEMVREIMALQRELAADQARRAFDEAISAAKAELPTITKNKHVGFDSRKAGAARTDYKHETLDEIARAVTPVLARHGLSYRYRVTSDTNQPISVTCIVSHRGGHSEETTLVAGRDDSGNKNSIQAIGSTLTYLQRYTLKAALGLAAADDDDGRKADEATIQTISEDQAIAIREMVEATGSSMAKFLEFGKLERLSDMAADQFEPAMKLLRQKAAKR